MPSASDTETQFFYHAWIGEYDFDSILLAFRAIAELAEDRGVSLRDCKVERWSKHDERGTWWMLGVPYQFAPQDSIRHRAQMYAESWLPDE